jgi:hypothetical protein
MALFQILAHGKRLPHKFTDSIECLGFEGIIEEGFTVEDALYVRVYQSELYL